MAISVDDKLTAIAPEMCSVSVERRQVIIDMASGQVGTVFGDNRDLAIAYLAAHMLTMADRAGNSGPVSSVKEGDLAISYAAPQKGAESYAQTSYGAEFVRLRSQHVFGPRTRKMC